MFNDFGHPLQKTDSIIVMHTLRYFVRKTMSVFKDIATKLCIFTLFLLQVRNDYIITSNR